MIPANGRGLNLERAKGTRSALFYELFAALHLHLLTRVLFCTSLRLWGRMKSLEDWLSVRQDGGKFNCHPESLGLQGIILCASICSSNVASQTGSWRILNRSKFPARRHELLPDWVPCAANNSFRAQSSTVQITMQILFLSLALFLNAT